jgi:hypothetical protein
VNDFFHSVSKLNAEGLKEEVWGVDCDAFITKGSPTKDCKSAKPKGHSPKPDSMLM